MPKYLLYSTQSYKSNLAYAKIFTLIPYNALGAVVFITAPFYARIRIAPVLYGSAYKGIFNTRMRMVVRCLANQWRFIPTPPLEYRNAA